MFSRIERCVCWYKIPEYSKSNRNNKDGASCSQYIIISFIIFFRHAFSSFPDVYLGYLLFMFDRSDELVGKAFSFQAGEPLLLNEPWVTNVGSKLQSFTSNDDHSLWVKKNSHTQTHTHTQLTKYLCLNKIAMYRLIWKKYLFGVKTLSLMVCMYDVCNNIHCTLIYNPMSTEITMKMTIITMSYHSRSLFLLLDYYCI